VIGAALVGLLTVLGLIPRLIQISRSNRSIYLAIGALVLGGLFGTYLSFTQFTFSQSVLFLLGWGVIHGIFNGMLAAALVEILNVFPLLSKRIGLEKYMLLLLMAIVFGKILGSLFQWLILVK